MHVKPTLQVTLHEVKLRRLARTKRPCISFTPAEICNLFIRLGAATEQKNLYYDPCKYNELRIDGARGYKTYSTCSPCLLVALYYAYYRKKLPASI